MRRSILLLSVLLGGCAYYNGMYNANRLAHSAEKAEREGRTFDAASLWGQVGVKVDTMLARHANSKWADDAKLLRGKSFQRLGDCNSAVTVLRDLLATSMDSSLVEEGSFLLGRCYQSLGNPEGASQAFERLVNSADPVRRREALYQHGRSLRMGGRYDEALQILTRTDDPRARGERAAALAGTGQVEAAELIADSLIGAADTTAPWDSLLSLMGQRDPMRASALTDRLIALPDATPVQRANWLISDAERLGREDPDRGHQRITQALGLGSIGPAAARGRLILLRIRMVRATDIDSLRAIQGDLDDLMQTGGATGILLGRYVRSSAFVVSLIDSVRAAAQSADMRLFLAAEAARDSLEMPRLALAIFRELVDQQPASPYAPKALLALASLDSSSADAAGAVLREQYSASPYTLAAEGQDSPGFTALEDSLLTFANTLRRGRPGPPARSQSPGSQGGRLPEN
ncbi:MAG: tetratricopeptide repeat protein [Gemmatimonadota bacterium]